MGDIPGGPPAPYRTWSAHRASFSAPGDYNAWVNGQFALYTSGLRTGHSCACGAKIPEPLLAAQRAPLPKVSEVIELLSSDDDDDEPANDGLAAPVLPCNTCAGTVCGACGVQFRADSACDLSVTSPKAHALSCPLRYVHALSQHVERVRRVITGVDHALKQQASKKVALVPDRAKVKYLHAKKKSMPSYASLLDFGKIDVPRSTVLLQHFIHRLDCRYWRLR
jgi:hypothetical protein